MCTLTYLPLNSGEFVFTSNRDEKAQRAIALPPQLYEHDGGALLYPKDPQGNGSWIVASAFGGVACLLNGAATPHVSMPPYRVSRGMVLVDFFTFKSVDDFLLEYNFDDIEPFTLVAVKEDAIHQIRWNGDRVDHHIFDTLTPRIWSSATLYAPNIIANRNTFFHSYIQEINPDNALDKMLGFHYFDSGESAEKNIILRAANGTETVSISQVKVDTKSICFDYFDIKQATFFRKDLAKVAVQY